MERFARLKADMPNDDKNYCVPIALAIMADKRAVDVSNDMIAKRIRKKRCGVYESNWSLYMKDELGLEFIDVTQDVTMAGGRTVKTAERVLNPKGKYLIVVRGHVLAYADGQIQDWSKGRKHRPRKILMLKDGHTPESPLKKAPKKKIFKVGGHKMQSKSGAAAVKKTKAYGWFKQGYNVSQVAKMLEITYGNAHYYKRCWEKTL